MKTITLALFAIIAIIGAIAIIITKLYYKDKEDQKKADYERELGLKDYYSNNQSPRNRERKYRKNPNYQEDAQKQREIAAFSQNLHSSGNNQDMFNDYYGEPILDSKFINKPSANQDVAKAQGNPNAPQTPKTEEIKNIINESKPSDAEKIASKISQDPMTSKQKEFIQEQKKGKLVIDNTGGSGIKVIKSDDSNTENAGTKFGEIKRVNLNGSPVVSTTEDSKEVEKIDPKALEETLQDLMKDSNIENTPLIQEIRDEISSDKPSETVEEPQVETKTEEEVVEDTEENKDESYIGELPVFKKDKPKTGETTLDDHQPQGYVDDIPSTESLDTKEEEEAPAVDEYGVITPIYNDKNVSGAVETVENLRSNLNNGEEVEEDYEDDFISITPLTEEEIRAEFQEESATINPIEESESKALKEFKDDVDETAKEKAEAKEELKKLREENTAKLFNVSKENKESLNSISNGSSVAHKVESINPPEAKEEILIDGEVYEVSKGMSIMFIHNNETYSSTILALKPGFVGVKYRGRNVWVKHSRIKKVFR